MLLQFQKEEMAYLHTCLRQNMTQEQTLEVRLSDGMPDIGTVLSTRGQVLIRGKEWDHDRLSVNGGTMVWVQYLPEGEDTPKTVEGWLPFQMHWSLPQTQQEGVMLTQVLLKSAEARSVNARKLMLKTNVTVLLQALAPQKIEVFKPSETPTDVQIRMDKYPVLLPMEANEKAFQIEESFPASWAGESARILATYLQPQVTEHKIIGDKIVFRGRALLSVLYTTDDNIRQTRDFELPFSQYAELNGDYSENVQVVFWPGVTALETQFEQNTLQVKAGIVCQYCIRHRQLLCVAQDAYSPLRKITVQTQELELPAIAEMKIQSIHAECDVPEQASRLLDVQTLPQTVTQQEDGDVKRLRVPVTMQAHYYDEEHTLRTCSCKWEDNFEFPVDAECTLDPQLWVSGVGQGMIMQGNIRLQSELTLNVDTLMNMHLTMLTGLELGEAEEADQNRPSVILCKAGERTLWEIAKMTGSTVNDIMQVNQLQTEPDPEQVLLIPVK